MKQIIFWIFVAIIFLSGSIFATQASAQYQLQSVQYKGQGLQGTRTPVNGTYTNSNYGVQITLPDGWSSFEMKRTSGGTLVMITLEGFQAVQGWTTPTNYDDDTYTSKKLSNINSSIHTKKYATGGNL